ncbi:MAG TPA: hypothetical protein VMZ53_18955 [Kofleriaceae bacterium]|nr:hypothetical protein [Kofleriaceae bacterium]
MKKLLQITFALTLTSFAAGCHDASKDIEKYADKMCACKDAACGEKVLNDFASWIKDNKNARGDQDKAAKAAERIGKCAIESGVSLDKLQSALSGL